MRSIVDYLCQCCHLLLCGDEGLSHFLVRGRHRVVHGTNVGVVGHVHLGDGIGDGSQAVIVTHGGRGSMVPRRPCGGSTLEVGVVRRDEVGLHVLPIFLGCIACCPCCDVGCEDPRLLDFAKSLVHELYHRVWYLRYDGLHVEFFQIEEHLFDWVAWIPRSAPLYGGFLFFCGRPLPVPAL